MKKKKRTKTLILSTLPPFQKKKKKHHSWSPEYTLTEDFALGMELKKRGWHCRYVQEYLAIGEAPDQVRNCFQQRSRWTKGHFQIIFNPLRNPLFQRGLPLFDRLMYCSGTWCYFVGAVSTPLLAVVPLITIWVRTRKRKREEKREREFFS